MQYGPVEGMMNTCGGANGCKLLGILPWVPGPLRGPLCEKFRGSRAAAGDTSECQHAVMQSALPSIVDGGCSRKQALEFKNISTLADSVYGCT